MEPEPVVPLNNAEALFATQQREEEEAILMQLSRLVSALCKLCSCTVVLRKRQSQSSCHAR